jgi:O-glycosyl hydrolase
MLYLVGTFLLCGHIFASANKLAEVPKTWLTQCDPTSGNMLRMLEPQLTSTAVNNGKQVTISLSLNSLNQKMEGYGAGLPQSSASVLYKLKQSNADLYNYVLHKLFASPSGTDQNSDAIGLNMLRFPIGSCDFSIANTSYDEVKNDFSLNYFQIDSDSQTYIVNVLKDVKKVNPNVRLIGK